jgi:hypothetical protein
MRVVSEQGLLTSDISDQAFEVVNNGPEYYLSPTGDDANGGKTPNRPMRTLRAILDSFDLDSGDRINVAAGTYLLDSNIVITQQDSGVTIQGPANAGAIFNRQNTSEGTSEIAFDLQNADNITFDSITVTAAEIGINAANNADSDDLTVRNSRIFGNQTAGILLGSTNDRLIARNNEVYGLPGGSTLDNQFFGISLRDTIDNSGGNDHLVEGNDIFDNSIGVNMTGLRTIARNNQIHGNATGIRAFSPSATLLDGLQIRDNEIYANSTEGINAFGTHTISGNEVYGHTSINYAITANGGAQLFDNTIRNNINGLQATSGNVFNNRILANTGVGLNVNFVVNIDRNSIYSNSIGIQGAASFNGQITNNLIYANINRGLLIENSSAGTGTVQVWNNTLYQQVGDAVRLQNSARNVQLSNNIITILSGFGINVDNNSQTGFVSDYNLIQIGADPNARFGFWNGNRDTLTSWQTATSRDASSLSGDPLFIDIDGADNRFGFSGGIDGGADDNFYRRQNSPATDRGDGWNAARLDRDGFGRMDDPAVINAGRTDLVSSVLASNLFTATGAAQPAWRSNNTSFAYNFPSGFTFPFYGTTYSSVNVSTEGFLQFGVATSAGDNNNSPEALAMRPRIAPLWDNLRTNATGDDIFVDTSVAGQVKFRWNATNESNNSDAQFAVTLFANGEVRFDYGPGNTNLTPTVGISSGNGITYQLVPGYDGATSLANANSVLFSLSAGVRDLGAYEYRGNSSDVTPPTIVSTLPAIIGNGGATAASIGQIALQLSEAVLELTTQSSSLYELRSSGANDLFGDSDDVLVAVAPSYDAATSRLTLLLPASLPGGSLAAGRYRLTVNSSAVGAIHDLSGNRLDGDSNGSAGGSFIREFRIVANTPPALSGSYTFPSIVEDIANNLNPGTRVSTMLLGRFVDADGPGQGIAITSIDNSHGVWEFTLDGINYSAIAPRLSGGQALLLGSDSTTRVRFRPNANFNGPAGGIVYRAWDQRDGSVPGSSVLLSSLEVNSFSLQQATSTINVTPVNDPPTDLSLSGNQVDEKLPVGTLVGRFTSVDADSTGPFQYTLVDGPGASGNVRFSILGDELFLAQVLDFELQPSHSIRVRVTDELGASREQNFTITVSNTPVRITGVYARGKNWNSDYLAMMANSGLGSVQGGYRLLDGAEQLRNDGLVTWQTIDQISVSFDEDAIVNAQSLQLINGNNKPVLLSNASGAFSYDPISKTARWTLAQPLAIGRYVIVLHSGMTTDGAGAQLDGEWQNGFSTYASSGNGVAGGSLYYRMNYLPGDVDLSGQANPSDASFVRGLTTSVPNSTNFRADFNGDNIIDLDDVNALRLLRTQSLIGALLPNIPIPERNNGQWSQSDVQKRFMSNAVREDRITQDIGGIDINDIAIIEGLELPDDKKTSEKDYVVGKRNMRDDDSTVFAELDADYLKANDLAFALYNNEEQEPS